MMHGDPDKRLERLLGYLEHDPDNVALLRDVADAALQAGQAGRAGDIFARLRDLGELTDADSNQWAIAAMRSGEPELAARTFAGLLEQQPGNAALKFNLAWALALAKDFPGARELLDEELTASLPQAAQLEVQLMHEAGEFEQAVERAHTHLRNHGDYPPLMAAISVLALDVEDEALARSCADKAGSHPDAITTLGTLELGGDDREQARAMFEQALSANAQSPRAWIGLGLAELLDGNATEAGEHIDKGAGIFGDHLGSWIAAGWAWLLAGDRAKARERFEHAAALDGSFAESQGSLAVVELMEGNREAGGHRLETALRLDHRCFSAAFARVLLTVGEGDAEKAQRIVELALKQPLGSDGISLGEAIARMAR